MKISMGDGKKRWCEILTWRIDATSSFFFFCHLCFALSSASLPPLAHASAISLSWPKMGLSKYLSFLTETMHCFLKNGISDVIGLLPIFNDINDLTFPNTLMISSPRILFWLTSIADNDWQDWICSILCPLLRRLLDRLSVESFFKDERFSITCILFSLRSSWTRLFKPSRFSILVRRFRWRKRQRKFTKWFRFSITWKPFESNQIALRSKYASKFSIFLYLL